MMKDDWSEDADRIVWTLITEMERQGTWDRWRRIADLIFLIRLHQKSHDLESRHLSGEPDAYAQGGSVGPRP